MSKPLSNAEVLRNAFNSFLSGIPNETTREHYKAIILHFSRFLRLERNKSYFEANGADIIEWRNDLLKTGGAAGYPEKHLQLKPNSRNSVENKTCAVSAFFKHLRRPSEITGESLIASNPVEALHARFKIEKYGSSKKVGLETFNLLIAQIDPQTTLGQRDLALILGYFYTGRRNSEWVRLQWGNIDFNANPVTYTYVRKGRLTSTDEIPQVLLDRILLYCRNRWGDNFRQILTKDSFIFTSFRDDKGRPLTEQYVWKLMKSLASKAGIDPQNITVHGLRHLHAKSCLDAGANIMQVQARLNHKSLATTQIYLSALEGQKNPFAGQLENMLKTIKLEDKQARSIPKKSAEKKDTNP